MRRPVRQPLRLAALGSGLLAAGLLVGACSSPQDDYCSAIEDHQQELIEIAAEPGPGAVFAVLPVYRDLHEEAPPDLRDEWSLVVDRLAALDGAFEGADLDPASYDPKKPPEGLTDDQREAIEVAARNLGATETREAMAGIEQQARDVCKTELGGEPVTE